MKTTRTTRKKKEAQTICNISPTTKTMLDEMFRPRDKELEHFLRKEILRLQDENLCLRVRLKIHGIDESPMTEAWNPVEKQDVT